MVEGATNKVQLKDSGAHNWYRFVLSFPPHLVREYLRAFNAEAGDTVLDPFCGTGTTLVECKKSRYRERGYRSPSNDTLRLSGKGGLDTQPRRFVGACERDRAGRKEGT